MLAAAPSPALATASIASRRVSSLCIAPQY
jgi:hypothetical protein